MDTIFTLNLAVQASRVSHYQVQCEAFLAFAVINPELASKVSELLGDQASIWMTTPNRALKELTPYQVLAKNDEASVHKSLTCIEYGVFT